MKKALSILLATLLMLLCLLQCSHVATHLGRGHRRVVVDAREGAAADAQGRAFPGHLRDGVGPHPPQRLQDAPHRPRLQRGVAEEAHRDGKPGRQPRQKACQRP